MTTSNFQKTERQYYIDWLRILLILSVFLFHIGMIFNPWEWHIKNNTQYAGFLKNSMIFLHYWRMPLLFLIAGAGTFYALGKRSARQYISERIKRLMIPLAIGVFTLVPIQVYIEKQANYESLIQFYRHMFEGIYPTGNFSWHHLWFIAYLFVISLFISPFLKFFRSNPIRRFSRWITKIASKKLGLNLALAPIMLSQFILRPFFPENTHALIDDWAAMAYYMLFFMFGFILLSNIKITESIKKQRFLFLIEAVIATIVMFTSYSVILNPAIAGIIWDITSMVLAWSCGLAAVGFAKKHLNFNSKFRKTANEAIYPFYLLHQPVIVVIGSYVIQWQVSDLLKFIVVTLSSLFVTIAIYRILIRPMNVIRFIFGMKGVPRVKKTIPVRMDNNVVPAAVIQQKAG